MTTSTKRQRVIGFAGQKPCKTSRAGLIARYHFALWSAKRSNCAQSTSTKRQRVIGFAGQKPCKTSRAGLIARYHFALWSAKRNNCVQSNSTKRQQAIKEVVNANIWPKPLLASIGAIRTRFPSNSFWWGEFPLGVLARKSQLVKGGAGTPCTLAQQLGWPSDARRVTSSHSQVLPCFHPLVEPAIIAWVAPLQI
jgi:hypothetical protein